MNMPEQAMGAGDAQPSDVDGKLDAILGILTKMQSEIDALKTSEEGEQPPETPGEGPEGSPDEDAGETPDEDATEPPDAGPVPPDAGPVPPGAGPNPFLKKKPGMLQVAIGLGGPKK